MFDTFCRLALKNYISPCLQYTGSPLWNSGYEGSKIDLLSKIWIFSEKMPKVEFFKKSEKNVLTSKMEQNPSSCSIGIWNYHLAPSKSKSRILLCPYASPLWTIRIFVFQWSFGKLYFFSLTNQKNWLYNTNNEQISNYQSLFVLNL